MLVNRAGIDKRHAITGKTLIRLHLQKKFDLGLCFLPGTLKFPFLFSSKLLVNRAGIDKRLATTGKTLIRLHLQKQFDLGLCCLPGHFRQGTHVRNFRTAICWPFCTL